MIISKMNSLPCECFDELFKYIHLKTIEQIVHNDHFFDILHYIHFRINKNMYGAGLIQCVDRGDIANGLEIFVTHLHDFDQQTLFCSACHYGEFDIAKWLLNLDCHIDIHAIGDWVFVLSCKRGHIDIAKWLLTIDSNINIHAYEDDAFIQSCRYDHIDIAKWLLTLDGRVNIHTGYDLPIRLSCEFYNINIVKWLLTLDHFDDEAMKCVKRHDIPI